MTKTKTLKFLLAGFLLALIFYVFLKLNSDSTIDKIMNNEIQFSPELGWINWNHANPEGTMLAYKDFLITNSAAINSFSFEYSQHMGISVFGVKYKNSYKERRKFHRSDLVEEQQNTFLDIFVSVSNGFEKMQGEFPYSTLGSAQSSFREGDLKGNLISFYLAISNKNISELKSHFTFFDKEKTMNLFLKNGLKKEKWNNMLIDSSNNEIMQDLLRILKQIKNSEQ